MSSGTRYQARTSIAQYFGGTTWQSVLSDVPNGPLINGPLVSYGLSAVYPRWSKRLPDENFFLFPEPARGMGTIMVVHLPTVQERRLAIPAFNATTGSNGTKQSRMLVELHLYHLSQQNYAEPAEADLEAMIDQIYTWVESDITLGGVVYGAGETQYGIKSIMNPPVCQDVPERVEQYAKVSFQADFFFVA
jgi:hypothetical protein